MFCQNCGTYLEEGTKFCPNCGLRVERPEAVREPVAYEQPEEPVYDEPTVAAHVNAYEEPVAQPAAPVYEQPAEPVYEQPVYQQPAYQPVTPSPEANALSTPILIFGILGLSFAIVPYINFLGIIFSLIAKNKVKQYQQAGGELVGKAKVGNTLAKVGLILGIVFTAIFTIVIVAAIIAAIANR